MARDFYPGMGQAVAERTILRRKSDGSWETWADVAHRVAMGNSLLCPDPSERASEYEAMRRHLEDASILMSGRHLQHGDETQPSRNMEVFTNCATASSSFLLFYLLTNGSGVGRCYDDDMMLVDWDNAPTVRCVLDQSHPDFDYSAHESARDARHKYGSGRDVMWYEVPDNREGWATALEIVEVGAFEKIHRDKLLVLDFSKVRPKGSPIRGMQDRPASGPVPLMNAFAKAMTIRGAGLDRWKQALYIDHYFAECVLVGGARRSARMSTKTWRDRSVLDFITVKRPIEYAGLGIADIARVRSESSPEAFLWSSNNSVAVDADFWGLVALGRDDDRYHSDDAAHARNVFDLATRCAYADGTGEPGFLNVDRLRQTTEGLSALRSDYVGSSKFQVRDDTHVYLDRLMRRARKKRSLMIVNPCVTGETWVMTDRGPFRVRDLVGAPFTAVVDGRPYPSTGFWCTGHKEVFRLATDRGYTLHLTADHRVQVERSRKQKAGGGYNVVREWCRADELKPGDRIVLNRHEGVRWGDDGEFHAGWLVGQIVGNGGYNPERYRAYVRFWGEHKEEMNGYAMECIAIAGLKTRSDFAGGKECRVNDTLTTGCRAMDGLCAGLITPETKLLLPAIEEKGSSFYEGFLRGIFDADGTVACSEEKGRSVRLSQSSLQRLEVVQRMLARLGIASTIYADRHPEGQRELPDGKGGKREYECKATHELHISRDNIDRFADRVGFRVPHKAAALSKCIETRSKAPYRDRFTAAVEAVRPVGIEEVYDCTVDDVHAFDANGIMAHNCAEIALSVFGGFCVLADVVPYHCDTIEAAEDAFRVATRALIRVNRMDSIYRAEVARTNRIGVGITGVHEFAWKFFGLGFRDLIDEERSIEFWMAMSRFKRAVRSEAVETSARYGMAAPHTDNTAKPAGTTSKLMGLTEGVHLPAMEFYLRWVQFREDDPLVATYEAAGYPVRHLTQYRGTAIVGFPTSPLISTLGMGARLVTAPEATPEEQYRWLMLLEKYWLRGVCEDGRPEEIDTSNQISFTMKYDPSRVSYDEFRETIRRFQPLVKCCSVMPQEDTSSYEYLPEEAVTKAEYEAIAAAIREAVSEDVDRAHVDCGAGGCPVDFNK